MFRPATPGFIVTLTATILLALVSFNVPIIKSIYFLKASVTISGQTGDILLGTLGYCIELKNGTTCSKPSVGYEFDANALLGDNISFAQIPTVVVKWVTYALVLHIVALVLAAGSALFGLLAHVREFSMTCCSSCVSVFAAAIALIAFIFDLALFFIVKSRVKGLDGTATFGTAIWMTLAAWILLFFSGCFYSFGRCCISNRSAVSSKDTWRPGPDNGYADRMRLDAVKAEADRKARQARPEGGLPAFQEHEVTKPLYNGNNPQYLEESDDESHLPSLPGGNAAGIGAGPAGRRQPSTNAGGRQYTAGGYVPGQPGQRAVDEHYSPTRQGSQTGYPPQQGNRNYAASMHSSAPSTYSQSQATTAGGYTSPPPMPTALAQNNLAAQANHAQYPSDRTFGHAAGGTTFHSAYSHQQQPSNYSQYPQHERQGTGYNPGGFQQPARSNSNPYSPVGVPSGYPTNATSPPMPSTSPNPPIPTIASPPQNLAAYGGQQYGMHGRQNVSDPGYFNAQPQPQQRSPPQAQAYLSPGAHDRSYTLGGTGYAPAGTDRPTSTVSAVSDIYNPYDAYVQDDVHSPAPLLNTNVAAAPNALSPTSSRGPRGPGMVQSPVQEEPHYEDSPPSYEAGPAQPQQPAWAEKR